MTCRTVQRNHDLECRPSAGARVDRERPAKTGRALSHADQAEPLTVFGGGSCFDVEASSVVCNGTDERVAMAHQMDNGLRGLRMFDHVRQRLLDDSVHGRFNGAGETFADCGGHHH